MLVVIPAIAMGFLMHAPGGRWFGILIKGLLFVIAVAGIVFLQRRNGLPLSVAGRGNTRDCPDDNGSLFETKSPEKTSWDGFGPAFRRFNTRYLDVVRSAVVASCAGLYLKSTGGLVLEAGLDPDGEMISRKALREGGLVNQVAGERKAVLGGDLSPGTVMDGFAETCIQSFLGVPLLWENGLLGVLAIGSNAPDSFGEEDAEFMMRCAGILTEVMSVYHRGLRWETDQQIFVIHREIETVLRGVKDEEQALFAFVEQIRKIFPLDRVTLSVREGEEGVIHQVFGQVDALDRGTRYPFDEGLNGWVLKRNAPILIPDMAKGNYARPRYFQGEDTRHGFRSFLGIPLGRGETAWGCLSLESRQPDQYGDKGKEVLIQLSRYLEVILEQVNMTMCRGKGGGNVMP